ncbi:SGNH/GDSL hydrolase family protein [Streptomyces liliiviolaceus]|uniref:hypothetical protein n=1 Tax=Streptomyces liliiviolaceus TaxID=2823109 RepID=UPI001FFD486F|nr:hypothetical protein [Streptomyces liliiviolaceus]
MARFRTRLARLGSAAALTAGALAPAQLAGAQPAAAADYDWVALGDSYTAGVIQAAGDVFEYPRDGCERTDRSYPQVIDRDLGSFFELTNVLCQRSRWSRRPLASCTPGCASVTPNAARLRSETAGSGPDRARPWSAAGGPRRTCVPGA